MAHGITSSDSMFSVRQRPWHKLGKVLEKSPKSVREALKVSGTDWKVVKTPVELAGGKFKGARVEEFFAMVRQDNGARLGAVGPDYEVIQNEQAFDLLANIIGSGAHWETMGSLWGGKRVWALVRLPDWIEIGGDKVGSYLLVEFSHDGTRALSIFQTKIRVVCNNTLTWAIEHDGVDGAYTVRHIGNVTQAIADASTIMQIAVRHDKQWAKVGGKLASSKMSEKQLRKVVDELWPNEDTLTPRGNKGRAANRDAVVDLFLTGKTIGNAPGTKWVGYNAILEHWQHDAGGGRVGDTGRFVRSMHDPSGFARRSLELVQAA